MELVEQLRTAAAESGIADLALAPGEACAVELAEGPEVTFELSADGERLFLYAPLLDQLPVDRNALFETALALNLFGRETAGATIAYDGNRDELLLTVSRDQSEKPIDFPSMVGTFVAAREHCVKALGDVLGGAAPSANGSDTLGQASGMRV